MEKLLSIDSACEGPFMPMWTLSECFCAFAKGLPSPTLCLTSDQQQKKIKFSIIAPEVQEVEQDLKWLQGSPGFGWENLQFFFHAHIAPSEPALPPVSENCA